MPYNGIKAKRDKERLAQAILAARGQQFETEMPVQGHQTSGYGMRVHPILKVPKFHAGVDIAAPTGTPVYATADGYVSQAQHKSSGSAEGNNVVIAHPGGQATKYAHLDRFAPRALKGGQVKKGELIGYVGTTGRSTGPHLHYGLRDRKTNRHYDPMEPMVPWQRSYAGV